jgi:CheY-like chemotaxis protein
MEEDIEPHFAGDASEAVYRLRDEPFDVIIFDIRLPAGNDEMWADLRDDGFQEYGIELIKRVKTDNDGSYSKQKNAQLGIFSIESLGNDHPVFQLPIAMPPQNVMRKIDAFYEDDFINFIRELSNQ